MIDLASTPMNLLQKLEWSGVAEGPGFGPMDSGPGTKYPACPECGGIKPGTRSDFREEAHGHRRDCELGAVLSADPTAIERVRNTKSLIASLEQEMEAIGVERAALKQQDAALYRKDSALYMQIRNLKAGSDD